VLAGIEGRLEETVSRTQARFFLAMARAKLGEVAAARESLRLADEWTRTHFPKGPYFARLSAEAHALLDAARK
jgi:hypothetical protein